MSSLLSKIYILFYKILGWKFHKQKMCDGIYIVPTHTSLWDAPTGLGFALYNNINPLTFLVDFWYDRAPKLFKHLKFFRTPDMAHSAPSSYVTFFKDLKKEVKRQSVDPRALAISICPEGQLAARECWAGSFMYLSKILKLPIYVLKIDYRNKEVSVVNVESPIHRVGRTDTEVMDDIRAIVDPNWARWPEKVSNIRLESEINLDNK